MQVYTGKINACAALMAEVYETAFIEYAWACSPIETMEYPVCIHLVQD